MRIVYTGPSRAVEVPGLGMLARRGEPIDVPEDRHDVARSLLQQECWTEAEQPAAKRSKATKENE
ncbi:hypothetical protein [Allokutzneria albata]|uniref:Uncharacterized protein n=1 Tax=Allokutzneria albata TaxID=211114 RepID=A0A1H0DUG9_ALLAB|nr:hypothetical protein [Allokutzneria albata]SDN73834.1 hypothetical protein SAMN04489726_8003 [Allokutzneria albata]